jgi:hypothetical protein
VETTLPLSNYPIVEETLPLPDEETGVEEPAKRNYLVIGSSCIEAALEKARERKEGYKRRGTFWYVGADFPLNYLRAP